MEKIKFLKLHEAADNTSRIIRDSLIIAAEKVDDLTVISHYDGDMSSQIKVHETPEKILSMSGERFIKLHDAQTNAVLCINIAYIKSVEHTDSMKDAGNNTSVDAFDLSFSVHETPERVYNYLLAATKEQEERVARPVDLSKVRLKN